ncbi:hypothetical protein IT568_06730, partial [bacterium]|nr:hypothetical protein [bacterium]
MFFNKFLSVALTLSATTFVFSQTEIPVQINSINGISAFDQNSNPKWTNSVTPFQFNNNNDLRPNPNNSQTSIFDFEIEFQVLQGFNVGFVKIYDLNDNLLGSFYLPQTTFPPGAIYTVNLVDLGAMLASPNNGYPNFKIWIYGDIIVNPAPINLPLTADFRFFDVNIFVDPVEDLHFASNSPLVLNSNNEYELSLSWTASPDPIIDANAPDVVIDKYRHFLINNEVKQTPAPTTTETITFLPALPGYKTVNDFSVIAEDNYGNKSTSYNKCYVYDSWKKTSSGTTPQLTTNLTPSPNGDLIFTGWFDVNGSMTINAKKLLISENSKISFVGGNSQLEFVSGSFENNSQISANG